MSYSPYGACTAPDAQNCAYGRDSAISAFIPGFKEKWGLANFTGTHCKVKLDPGSGFIAAIAMAYHRFVNIREISGFSSYEPPIATNNGTDGQVAMACFAEGFMKGGSPPSSLPEDMHRSSAFAGKSSRNKGGHS